MRASVPLALGDSRVHRAVARTPQDDMCCKSRPQTTANVSHRPLAATTKMQYKMRARPPLDERGKNETEIQIYSRKSELHRARGTLTHKNEKNHTDVNIDSGA